MEDFFLFWTFSYFKQSHIMNKVVLTGGSSGIGKSWKFFFCTTRVLLFMEPVGTQAGTNSVFPLVALDVRDTASIQSAIAKIISISRFDRIT
jgi:NADP-dependent 3-hydroxy acid dehydrogenase YdfG